MKSKIITAIVAVAVVLSAVSLLGGESDVAPSVDVIDDNTAISEVNNPPVDTAPTVSESNTKPVVTETVVIDQDLNCMGIAQCFAGVVTEVIDGDTLKVNGESIRFSLASAPELKGYGGIDARNFIETLCPVGSTVTVDEDDGQVIGSYGRMVALIHCNDVNLNSELLDSNLGYLEDRFCDSSEFAEQRWAQKHGCSEYTVVETTSNCDASYPDFCIPSPPPDLDCGDMSQKKFTVLQPDPHRFDGDKDGIGCE